MRVTIRPLSVWETSVSSSTVLPAGALLADCKVLRRPTTGLEEPYIVHFDSGGRSYTCPLYQFQPRTEAVAELAETPWPAKAVAV